MKRSISLLGACTMLIALDAGAQEAPVYARLRFTSAAGCGNAADFGARVQRRSPRIHFVTRGTGESVSVRIVPNGAALAASVTLSSGGRRITERKIEAETCEDALDALALVVAVTLEGQESRRQPRRVRPPRRTTTPTNTAPATSESATPTPDGETPPSEPTTPAAPDTNETPAAPESTAPAADATPSPSPVPAPEPPAPVVVDTPPPATRDARRTAWSAGAGAGVALSFGAAPAALPGWFVYGRFGFEIARPWSPEIIIGYASLGRDGFDQASGSADFRLQAASLELCPLQWSLGPVDWMPCGLAVYGRLKVRGYDTFDAASYSQPWAALGASVQLAAHLSIVELRAQIGVGAPLSRDTFRFEPDQTVHHVSPVTISTSLAAGLRFP